MLYEFELSKIRIVQRRIKVNKGKVAEAEFRKWLRQFLPKKYGVTAGYIISQGDAFSHRDKLPHYDVIIYDELNSPILWVEGSSDESEQGKNRAIPAEYVHGVFEVKSTFNEYNILRALEKLNELAPLLAEIDNDDEYYKRYIPKNFYMGTVFFEYLKQDQKKQPKLLDKLIPTNFLRGFRGGIVLQAEGIHRDNTGKFGYTMWDGPVPKFDGEDRSGNSESREILPGKHITANITWSASNLSWFAFDLVAVMNGTYRPGTISSNHGMFYVLP